MFYPLYDRMIRYLAYLFGLIFVLAVLAWPLATQAEGLPPRATPTPVSAPQDDNGGGPENPLGAFIELQVTPARSGLWAVVQWQDSTGSWHDVDGWRGSLEPGGSQRWWVAAGDFGKGPFRWMVQPGGPDSSLSAPFKLPSGAGETVRVSLTLP